MSTRAAPPQTKKKKTNSKSKSTPSTTTTAKNNGQSNSRFTSSQSQTTKTKTRIEADDDSENDPDFVPPTGAGESGSGSEDSDDEAGRNAKKVKLTVEMGDGEEEKRRKEETRQKLWEDFQASISTPPPRKEPELPKTVKIVKKYRFAGEDVTKVEEVPQNSPDAKKWPLWNPIKHAALNTPPLTVPTTPSSIARSSGTPQPQPQPQTPASTPDAPVPATHPRPGLRKARKSLDAMFATAKAKKLSTLDKSAMDWKQHVEADASKEIREDLEANRKGGGFLEKVEFLARVEERTEAVREGASGKRRRG